MKTKEYFLEEILRREPKVQGPSEYGSRVLPVLELYKGLSTYQERRSFQDALELLLQSEVAEERAFGVDICLGFFVFSQ
jgi:hypothetical protein